jgi:putative phosphoesterase
MRVAALYDVHGNLPALEAVLAEVRQAGIEEIVVGGDVLPGPMPRACLERLRDEAVPVHFIHGNGESGLLAEIDGSEAGRAPEAVRGIMRWVGAQLEPEHARWLRTWPGTFRMTVPAIGEVLFCHATPRNDTEIFTRLTPDERLRPLFEGLDVDLVVCGHTHMQHDRTIAGLRVVNAGSVGMPFGKTGANWLVLGPDVQFRHTAYDLADAARRVRQSDYPEAEEFAGRDILNPRAEAEMLEALGKAELR